MLLSSENGRPDHEPPVTRDELKYWAWERAEHEREPLPTVGEYVLFRPRDWQAPVPAVVAEVQDITRVNDGHGAYGRQHDKEDGRVDPHVWRWDENQQSWVLRDDPWPWVIVELEDGRQLKSKEARVRGSAGWLRPGSRFAPRED